MKRTSAVINQPPARIFIGIDNGVSGSIGWVSASGDSGHVITPVFSTLNYQKKAKNLNRINVPILRRLLRDIIQKYDSAIIIIERPMINPGRFQASLSAIRALEATLISLEALKIPHMFVDSREWQKVILPQGIKGSAELKKASLEIGKRLFPHLIKAFKGDADGILMAEWAKRINL